MKGSLPRGHGEAVGILIRRKKLVRKTEEHVGIVVEAEIGG